jgi:hypothetical protein
MNNLVFVDCEARGPSPVSGILTEFGAVHYVGRATFHGRLFEGGPDPDNPAIPIPGERVATEHEVATRLTAWLREVCGKDRPTFVSDNVAYDWQWIAGLFDPEPPLQPDQSVPPARPRASRSSTCRSRKLRSSSRLRQSQPVTSSLHLLVLHDAQAGTTLSRVYRPPREIGSTQSRCRGPSVRPQ